MTNSRKLATDASEITVEEKIKALYALQQIESQIDDINRVKGELPFEVQDLEDEVAGLEERAKRMAIDIDDHTKASKAKKEDIEVSKGKIKRYEEQQQTVRNNREYESLSKEIEYQNLEIELCEKQIKEISAQNKLNKKSLEEAKNVLGDRKADLAAKKEELAAIDSETESEMKELEAQAAEVAIKIDERTLTAFNKIRQGMRNGIAVAMVKRDACSGCFNRIPPQRQLDIRMSKKIIVCEYCGRILVSDLIETSAE